MRPRGDVRELLSNTVAGLVAELGPVTARQVVSAAVVAQVGYDVARCTLKNMVRSGELKAVGKDRRAGSTRWITLYEPAGLSDDTPQPWGGIEALAEVMKNFPAGD